MSRLAAGVLLATIAMLSATDARADYDVSGRWGVDSVQNGTQHSGSVWDIVQVGTDLSFSVVGGSGDPVPGVIDLGTGEMVFSPPPVYPACGPHTLEGFAAANGNSFTLTHIYHRLAIGPPTLPMVCISYTFEITGSRCGNGILDSGETCEDGNMRDGDCCSSACTLDTVGTTCSDDYDVCTDDVCDGAGICQHNDNTAPCEDVHGCGTGSCASGTCIVSAPEPAGTSCDLDESVCSIDVCDGSGACSAGETMDCAPCGFCDAHAGCLLDATGCFADPMSMDLRLRVGKRMNFTSTFQEGTPVEDLGDPVTDTEYTLCFSESDASSGYPRLIYQATAEPGGVCGTEPCWESMPELFRYKNKKSENGLTHVKISYPIDHAFHEIRFRGKGEGLPLVPQEFATDLVSLGAMFITNDGVTRRCWAQELTPDKLRGNRFQGSRQPYADGVGASAAH